MTVNSPIKQHPEGFKFVVVVMNIIMKVNMFVMFCSSGMTPSTSGSFSINLLGGEIHEMGSLFVNAVITYYLLLIITYCVIEFCECLTLAHLV